MELPPDDSISRLIDKAHEARAESSRGHLGCSLLGHACDRYLWLSFRGACPESFPGRILRVFRRGQNEEATVVSDLRAIGVTVTATGQDQSRVDFGSHVSGSVDGILLGLPHAPKTKAILEVKTHSDKSFKAVVKDGVKTAHFKHFVQMQLYMKGMGLSRALYYAVNKNDDAIYTEWVHYESAVADKYVERGHRIALSDRMPEPLSADPSWYECKYCSAYDLCHAKGYTKVVSCRTCANATPLSDSTWHCAKWDDVIPSKAQADACPSHVLHPDLVPWPRREGKSEWEAVYVIDGREVRNGEQSDTVFSSREIVSNPSACAAQDWKVLHDLRKQFDGTIVG